MDSATLTTGETMRERHWMGEFVKQGAIYSALFFLGVIYSPILSVAFAYIILTNHRH